MALKSEYTTVCVHGDGRTEERTAASANIKPGHLLEVTGGEFDVHGVANGVLAPLRIAAIPETTDIENAADDPIDTAYADGDTVYAYVPKSGDRYYMRLAATNATTAGETTLGSAGDGALQAVTVDATILAGAVRLVALEDKSSIGSEQKILVEVL